jgi:CheY-like chemotaxis protein
MTSQPVLLAEDNEHDALFVARLFQTSGILNPLQVVSNGREAIWYLKGEGRYSDRAAYPRPILLLLDLRMPVADGLDVLIWLQTQPKPNFPIVVLTAFDDLRAMREAYRLGAQSFLLKPIQELDFLPLVRGLYGMEFEGLDRDHGM